MGRRKISKHLLDSIIDGLNRFSSLMWELKNRYLVDVIHQVRES